MVYLTYRKCAVCTTLPPPPPESASGFPKRQRSLEVQLKVTSPPRQRDSGVILSLFNNTMDGYDHLSASGKAEATELQRMIAIEQQKAQFQAQVCMLTMLTCAVALAAMSGPVWPHAGAAGAQPQTHTKLRLRCDISSFQCFIT